MDINFEELVYQITTRFDASITPAEARALSGSVNEKKDIKWLIGCLHDCAIDCHKIDKLQDIDFERFTGVGIVVLAETVYLFSFDELRQGIYFYELGGDVLGNWEESKKLL